MSITVKKRYEVDGYQIINRGNYSYVFHCKDKENQELKLAAKKISLASMGINKSLQEYEILDSLQVFLNPHIVKCYDIEQIGDDVFIILELCELGDLSKKIYEMRQKNQRFTAEQILDFIIQVVDGAFLLYKKKIFHRDIKPQNILLTMDSNNNLIYKICDFGSARFVQDMGQAQNFTKYLTPLYQSPEISIQQIFSPKSDIFSFGLIIYELCFLKLPYITKEEQQPFFNQLKDEKFQFDLSTIEGSNEQINLIKLIIEQTIVYKQENRINWEDLYAITTDFKQYSQTIYEQQNAENFCYTIAKQHVNLLMKKSQLVNVLMLEFQNCFQLNILDISLNIFKLAFTTLACCKHLLCMSIISFMEGNYKNLSSNLKKIIKEERFQELSGIYKQKFKQDPDIKFNFDDINIKKFNYALDMAHFQINWINDINKNYQNQFKDLHDHFIQFAAFAKNIGSSSNYEDYIYLWNDLFQTQIEPKIPQNNQQGNLNMQIQELFNYKQIFSFKQKFQHK
ncbi:unnamed protein product [Paramecium octaurelia]|uniref:Protein kinase domain-containing protein n=1 Tax=Paramecium octaurelia TaxID=43137 RepID=A0A8S1UXW6_PAROT|nr:unnamed protein product [Paramecium octaurelia]